MGVKAELTYDAVVAAARRIDGKVHRTPVFTSRRLDEAVGAEVFFKGEHLQGAGAFKLRGATNAVAQLSDAERKRGVIAHSSGNHAQALALAAARAGVACTIVMPVGSSAIKRAATLGYGAWVVDCDDNQAAREATCAAEIVRTGAVLVHPYDDPRVIAGAGTAALELLDEVGELDAVITPVGGGGLLAGTCLAARGRCAVWGAEPAGADDAWRSLEAGARVTEQTPQTVADGLRTCLGERNFAIIRDRVAGIGRADDQEILAATDRLLGNLKQVVEPSAAVPLACLLNGSVPARGRVGVILSGGNVRLRPMGNA